MNADVRATAIRFADLWAIDPHQMVDEIYADDIEMENMANPTRVIRGGVQLHAVEDELTSRIPEHRHELVRVIVDGDVACLETMVVAPLTHEYAPACVWWWLDDAGKVAAEVGWFDWAERSSDSTRAHGTVPPWPPSTAERRSTWYSAMAERYASGWSTDPAGSALEQFSVSCTFGRVGRDIATGIEALRAARLRELDAGPGPARSMEVHRAIGERGVLAMLVTMSNANAVTRGTVVLTFGDDDLVVSERTYADWRRSLPVDQLPDRAMVGSPHWTLRGR